MKRPHRYFNWPTITFALGTAVLLPLRLRYGKFGPEGSGDAFTQLISGAWLVFGSVYVLAAQRSESLSWLSRLTSKRGATPRQARVLVVMVAGLLFPLGCYRVIRGILLFSH